MNEVQVKSESHPAPPDQLERQRALDPNRSILVQAPAGSGKTDLLTRRFLRLLAEVDEPGQVVAITFTNAAAAEMRHRILAELEKAADSDTSPQSTDEFSMDALAHRALERSRALGWKLLELPTQLRISTIDSFCRDLALQQPLLSGFGGGIGIAEQPDELYRRAARQTLEKISQADQIQTGRASTGRANTALGEAIEALLLWRDNNWREMEDLLVEMLRNRDRWMHDFVLDREPDWNELRNRLERPFANAVRESLTVIDQFLSQVPGAREEALELARFACEEPGAESPWGLAECSEIPAAPFADGLNSTHEVYSALAGFLQTQKGTWRSQKGLGTADGFPSTPRGRAGKAQFASLITRLNAVPGLESALAAVSKLPPVRYTEEDWLIVRACFSLLRHAAAELQVIFAEAGTVDFIEVAQIAESVLRGPDGLPTDAAIAVADGIRHILVDEFQDTSRRQHRLIGRLIAAWPERTSRTGFVVGDEMQSIYSFRDADAELFARVKALGLEIPDADPLLLDFVPLTANFRTDPSLVKRLYEIFVEVFAVNDCNVDSYSPSTPARTTGKDFHSLKERFKLHLNFTPQTTRGKAADSERETTHHAQTQEIVSLIQSHLERMEQACGKVYGNPGAYANPSVSANHSGEKYRIAVLGRTRSSLAPIAAALREAGIPFRALDLEKLKDRPEVLDALALARALLNPQDRVVWLGVLRAPWCGLSLEDLYRLTSADDPALLARPVPELLAERLTLLSESGRQAAGRVLTVLTSAPTLRSDLPTISPGARLEQIWLRLGGAACVDSTARANVDLLWSCLDSLPDGELDLLGPSLDAALEKLTALPDAHAGSDFGVQLMTIHKSKGLEFEVVIVPDLQAAASHGRPKLLSWLERGLEQDPARDTAEPDSADEITEFLVAPLQPKGADRGKSKAWVDRIYREREAQEARRILYVAATRAREELHLFARPTYKADVDGNLSLSEPSASLLATAWPALGEEIRARFEDWKAAAATPNEAEVEFIAASGDSTLLTFTSPTKPTLLRRLPADYLSTQGKEIYSRASRPPIVGIEAGAAGSRLYARHEGGLISRTLGTAVHALLEELSRLRKDLTWEAARASLEQLETRITVNIRAAGVNKTQAANLAAQALQLALNVSHDPAGQWILSPHADAASEINLAGIVAGTLRTVQVDRVFRAGLAPQSEGQQAWWIIDYKTAHADSPDKATAAALPELRKIFEPQLEAYGQILRNLHGPDAILRAGLYYPRMLLLDWWEL